MKIPLSYSLKNRSDATDKDARVLNGYVEAQGDPKKGGTLRTFKRPALDSAFVLDPGAGQGLYVPSNGEPGVIIDDILTRAPTAKTKKVSFGVQPSAATLNTAFSPSVTVRIIDSIGGVVNSSANVTLALASNPTGATLGGTLTQAASAGTATFNNLTLNRSGEAFTLRATSSGLSGATSTPFNLPTALIFTQQPAGADPDVTFTCEVTAQDTSGATDTNYTGNITVALYGASADGTLSGTLTVPAVAGVANFTNLSIDVAGSYSLDATGEPVATAYPPSKGVSNSFGIGGYVLTAGTDGLGAFGFTTSPSVGSITPTTYQGATINTLVAEAALGTAIVLTGNRAQGFFTTLTIDGISVLSSSAIVFSYNVGLDLTTWVFAPFLITSVGTKSVQIVP